jgi:regulation of enolase protein 1 (concanavalin A-like superfamily)
MIRASLAGGAPHASMLVTAGQGLAFQRRVVADGTSTHTAGAAAPAPQWVRLVRTGDAISAYSSPDGTNWTLVGTETVAMGSTVYVGLAVTSHDNGAAATATFDNVEVP